MSKEKEAVEKYQFKLNLAGALSLQKEESSLQDLTKKRVQ